MKKVLFGMLILFTVSAFAQEIPKFETYLGYTFTRVNSGIDVPAFSANGGLAEVAFNFNKFLGLVGSFPSVHNGNIHNLHLDQTLFGYMFGPRGSLRFGRVIPSFETLFGATHDSRSFRGVPVVLIGPSNTLILQQRVVNSATEFSMMAGGNLDLVLNHHLTFRPIKFDYLLTRFQPVFAPGISTVVNRNRNQNNLLYSTGFNFRF